MKKIDFDDSAFPIPSLSLSFGMSLRDWLAGQALQGMLAHSRGHPPHGYRSVDKAIPWHESIAAEAYELADSMLSERDK